MFQGPRLAFAMLVLDKGESLVETAVRMIARPALLDIAEEHRVSVPRMHVGPVLEEGVGTAIRLVPLKTWTSRRSEPGTRLTGLSL